MEILFVVDSVEDIEHKISLLDSLGAEIKFFVSSEHVAKLVKNKFVASRTQAIYNNNVNTTIDKYLKADNYKPTPTLLYYASAEVSLQLLDNIRQNLQLKPHTIYAKKRFSWWDKVKLWFYQKVIKLIFGINDQYASVKLQYFDEEVMSVLAKTNFRNHIFSIPNALSIEIENDKTDSYYNKRKVDKNLLYNPIVICLMLICYVVLERFLNLPFWVYLLVIALILATIINWIIMIVKTTFDERYKK